MSYLLYWLLIGINIAAHLNNKEIKEREKNSKSRLTRGVYVMGLVLGACLGPIMLIVWMVDTDWWKEEI